MSRSEEVDNMMRDVFGEGSVEDLGDGVRALNISADDVPDALRRLLGFGDDAVDKVQDTARDQVKSAFQAMHFVISLMSATSRARLEHGPISSERQDLIAKLEINQAMLASAKESDELMSAILDPAKIDDRMDLMVERKYPNGQAKSYLSMLVIQDMLNQLTTQVDEAIDKIELDRAHYLDPDSDNLYRRPLIKPDDED